MVRIVVRRLKLSLGMLCCRLSVADLESVYMATYPSLRDAWARAPMIVTSAWNIDGCCGIPCCEASTCSVVYEIHCSIRELGSTNLGSYLCNDPLYLRL